MIVDIKNSGTSMVKTEVPVMRFIFFSSGVTQKMQWMPSMAVSTMAAI